MQEKQNSFLKGAAILGIAGIIVKVMGVFFRIPLTNWIGAEGMSYYSSVYPIYSFFLLISLAGIPVAISRMISERTSVKNYAGAQKVFNVSVGVMAVIGGVSMAIVFFGADFIDSSLLKNPGT
ncbi:MAG: oligosaccharide flippase family protein, partial [Firmicutes bacterium]|nr:oligosaccharide flippase family protein [Bacillota bacterium]